MRYFLAIVVLSTPFIPICLGEETALSVERVKLNVEVINATKNGASVTGDEVTVAVYGNQQPMFTSSGNVDSEGRFAFENIPVGAGIIVRLSAKHQNMAFGGTAVAMTPGQTEFDARVKVYDVSFDNSIITVGTHHFVLKAGPESILIDEYMQLKNDSDMAVTSDRLDGQNRNIVVRVKLPEGFTNLGFHEYFIKNALVMTDDGFYDTMAIPPGKFQTVFSYSIPISSETMDITKKITLPTSEFMVFSQFSSEKVQGLGEPLGEIGLFDGGSAKYYQALSYKPGDTINLKVIDFNINNPENKTVIVLTIVFVIVGTLALLRLFGRKSHEE